MAGIRIAQLAKHRVLVFGVEEFNGAYEKSLKTLRFSIAFSTNVLINQLLLCLYTGGLPPSLLTPTSTAQKKK